MNGGLSESLAEEAEEFGGCNNSFNNEEEEEEEEDNECDEFNEGSRRSSSCRCRNRCCR